MTMHGKRWDVIYRRTLNYNGIVKDLVAYEITLKTEYIQFATSFDKCYNFKIIIRIKIKDCKPELCEVRLSRRNRQIVP